tara:strand:- start:322 stop:573 length:252 start_codon:yes stop_codon:yes gene_type:complete
MDTPKHILDLLEDGLNLDGHHWKYLGKGVTSTTKNGIYATYQPTTTAYFSRVEIPAHMYYFIIPRNGEQGNPNMEYVQLVPNS